MTSDQAPPAPLPIGEDRRAATGELRLGLPASLIISLLIHAVAVLASRGAPVAAGPLGPPPRIEAAIVKATAMPAPTPPPAPNEPLTVPGEAPVVAAERSAATTIDDAEAPDDGLVARPQLIGEPDFSEIEKSRVSIPIRVVLRIDVSPLGLADTVEVIEAGPLPSATLDLITKAFLKARYTPARSPGGKRAAALEITVNLQPAGPFAPLPTGGPQP